MNKVFEALEGLFDCVTCQGLFEKAQKYYDIMEEALLELKAIKEANPSEALEYLDRFINEMTYCLEHPKEYAKGYEKEIFYKYKHTLETTIKQYILKAQENEKMIEILKPYFQGTVFPSAIYFHFSCEEFDLLKRYFE